MPHTLNHAQRLLRELEPCLPDGVERVLDRPPYWDPVFCELFFERTEEVTFCDPQAGLKLARVAPRLAMAVPESNGAAGRREHNERVARAYSLLGSAQRVAERHHDADGSFQKALQICTRRKISGTCRVEIYLRLAVFRSCQKRFTEAFQLVARSTSLCESENDDKWLSVTLATRGAVCARARLFPEAVSVLSEVLGNYRLSPRVEYSATHNLAYAVSEAANPNLESALEHLRKARRLLGPRRSVQKCKLYWVEGLIHIRLGRTERAERLFRKALAGFEKFEAPYETALVGLDLSALLRFERRWGELEQLTDKTYRRFRELREDTEAVASLRLWIEAAQMRTLTEELITEVKEKIEEWMRRHPAPGTVRRRRQRR
ncbi:MAG: hypothetical protein GY719_31175 [bacterium]|nr:hypothetical protein [bacterium]